MTLDGLFANWPGLAPALGNHLWQSTLFAVIAGLLTLTLRKNRARARYWLWLAASVKFLIPFSLLIVIGSQFSLSRGSVGTNAVVYRAMDAVGQPFAQLVIPESSGATPTAVFPPVIHVVVPSFLAAWLCGFLVIVVVWFVRWRRISATVRTASPLREGREVEALRRLATMGGLRKGVQVLLSRASIEPGIFGIARPVLLWPESLSQRLDDAHLEAILAHELWHVRQRDNLVAVIHMSVEAIFWFHPLVWWLGARLVEERERACDEKVLEIGNDRQVYAESILKICEFCMESPLACVSGVTGADLKKRIVYIMTTNVSRKLDFGRKLLLFAAGLLAVIVPVAFGLVRPTTNWAKSQALALGTAPAAPMFESAMIRPNNGKSFESWIIWKAGRLMVTNLTLQKLIQQAYSVQTDRISGGPAWLDSQGYDIDAKVGESVIAELHELSPSQRFTEQKRMLQALLADRFKLAFHREAKEVSVYALTTGKNGPELQQAKPGDTYPNGFKDDHDRPIGAGIFLPRGPCKLLGQGVPIADLVGALSERLGRTVVDETGLKGNYDFTLDCFAPLRTPESEPSILSAVPEHAEALTKVHAIETASIVEAVSEQLGLELNLQTVPLEILVIDNAREITGDESTQTQQQDQSLAESVAASMPPARVYEAVSIKPEKPAPAPIATWDFPPDGFTATNVTLQNLIQWTYHVEGFQISGAPGWVSTERYDVQAKVDSSAADELRSLSDEQRAAKQQPMLLELLADNFKLEVHRETRELPVYELVAVGRGPKLQQAKSGESPLMRFGRGLITGQSMPIGPTSNGRASLVGELSFHLQRPVLNKTGLEGMYDFSLEWTSGDRQPAEHGPSIFTAVQEQLGLKLLRSNEQTAPVHVLVIDHVEEPSEN